MTSLLNVLRDSHELFASRSTMLSRVWYALYEIEYRRTNAIERLATNYSCTWNSNRGKPVSLCNAKYFISNNRIIRYIEFYQLEKFQFLTICAMYRVPLNYIIQVCGNIWILNWNERIRILSEFENSEP